MTCRSGQGLTDSLPQATPVSACLPPWQRGVAVGAVTLLCLPRHASVVDTVMVRHITVYYGLGLPLWFNRLLAYRLLPPCHHLPSAASFLRLLCLATCVSPYYHLPACRSSSHAGIRITICCTPYCLCRQTVYTPINNGDGGDVDEGVVRALCALTALILCRAITSRLLTQTHNTSAASPRLHHRLSSGATSLS